MKKRKQEILRKKEQSTVQSTEQYTEQPTVQSTVQPNDTYIYGVGMLAVLAIGICVFFAYNTSQVANKKQVQQQLPKRRNML